MRWIYKLPLRLRSLFRKNRVEQELTEEFRFHLQALIETNVAKGMSPEESRYTALRELGGLEQIREECRDMRRVNYVENFIQDLRFGLRMLARNRVFTAVAVLTLALGIGANTSIFTLINSLLLRPLPVQRPHELVLLGHGLDRGVVGDAQRGSWELFSYTFYQELRDHNRVFQDVCAFASFAVDLSVQEGNTSASVSGKLVSGNYFSVLGVRPLFGRLLAPEDDSPGAAPAAVVSYRFWSKQFSKETSLLGKTVEVNGTAFTIVGVTPPRFFGETLQTDPPDMWLPLWTQPQLREPRGQESFLTPQGPYWLDIIGRLKPGVTLEQAQANINPLQRGFLDGVVRSQVSAKRWEQIRNSFIVVTPGGRGLSELRENFRNPLYILLAAVGLILLIACANVANLLMARATARQREVSVRLALGAGRARLVRQFLTESILLAVCGGAVGLLFARWATMALVARVANGATYVPLNTGPDPRVLGFTLGICVLTGILFGLIPAFRASHGSITAALKGGVGTDRRGRQGPSNLLVISQVAVSLFLLIGAGLLVRALEALENQDWGFAREKVLVVQLDPKRAGYQPEQLPPLYEELLDRINALPDVHSSSLALYSWLSDTEVIMSIAVPGYKPQPDERTSVQINLVGPRYFETEGMTLLLGREFGRQDTAGTSRVAIVNESLVRRFFFGQNPIGRTLRLQPLFKGGDIEVVGVAKNAKYNSPRDNATEMVFLPVSQASQDFARHSMYVGDLEVRAAGSPTSVTAKLRSTIDAIDKNLSIDKVTTLNELVDRSLNEVTLIAALSTVFAVLALLLASVGLYGVMAYTVARRTNEIGVRMALGARKRDVLRLVVGRGLILTLAGVAVGLAAALSLGRVLASLLVGVQAIDPLTFGVVSLMLTTVAVLASYIPARRATKVDPMTALRWE